MAKKQVVFILIAVVAVLALLAGIGSYTGILQIGKRGGAVVRTMTAAKGDISSYVSASGSVEAADKADIYIDTPIKVTSVDVVLYQAVKKGARLFTLDVSSIENELTKLKINRKILELTPRSPAVDEETSEQLKAQNLKLVDLSISELQKRLDNLEAVSICQTDGIVTELRINEGAAAASVQPAVTIVFPGKLQARISVREYDIRSVKPGQTVRIYSDTMRNSEFISGTVAEVAPVAKSSPITGSGEITIEVTVQFDGQHLIMPGMSVSCDIYSDMRQDALIVPIDSLIEDKDGNKSVFVVDASDSTMHLRSVKTGITSDFEIEILEGLNEGDTVILDPQPSFKDGDRVILEEQDS